MLFKYKGIDQTGKKVSGTMEAINLENAKAKIKVKKVLYTFLKQENKSSLDFKIFSLSTKINNFTLSGISRDLSIYLNSGIPLISAINLLKQSYNKEKKLSNFFESIHTFLDEGKNFYSALESQKVYELPEFYKQSIKISEDGGLLQTVLLELSTFLKEQDRIKKHITQALIYPIFILVVSFFMVAFMLSFIVPKITSIFAQIDQELPTATKIVISLGNFFEHNITLVVTLFFLSFFSFVFLMKKSNKFKYIVDSFLLKVPFLGKLLELSELSRFAYMNSILIRSGIPVVQAINLSSNILNNSVIKKVFKEASSKVVEGERLSKILDNNKIFKIDTAFIHAISIGEETSSLSKILNSLADLYNEANKDKINIFLSLLEPIFMLVVGSIIGFIVVAMLLPIFSMNIG